MTVIVGFQNRTVGGGVGIVAGDTRIMHPRGDYTDEGERTLVGPLGTFHANEGERKVHRIPRGWIAFGGEAYLALYQYRQLFERKPSTFDELRRVIADSTDEFRSAVGREAAQRAISGHRAFVLQWTPAGPRVATVWADGSLDGDDGADRDVRLTWARPADVGEPEARRIASTLGEAVSAVPPVPFSGYVNGVVEALADFVGLVADESERVGRRIEVGLVLDSGDGPRKFKLGGTTDELRSTELHGLVELA